MTNSENDAMEIDRPDEETENKEMNNNIVVAAQTKDDHNTMAKKPTPVSPPSNNNNKAVVFSPELLQMYYARLFPFDMLHTWLQYNNHNNYFSRREFSFTVEPQPGEEIYMRHQSFAHGADLQKAMLKKSPVKMDIGAVYQQAPKDKNAIQKGKNPPLERELIFDVDMDDYDPVRHCGCQGAKICPKCWNFMKMAVTVVDGCLRHDFGFQHVAWFYSGRRGVHGWVCDEAARGLSDEGRSAVAKYLSVALGNEKNKDAAAVNLSTPLHPMLKKAYEILEPLFVQHMLPETGHGILATPTACRTFLQNELPDTAAPVRDKLLAAWTKKNRRGGVDDSTPVEKWTELQKHLSTFVRVSAKQGTDKSAKTMTTAERHRLEQWHVEVVFRHTYPRLDINVSTHRNHLLKSPFCVHPKTGRVCVPIFNVMEFDPFAVPTLPQLMRELDQYDASHSGNNNNDEKEEKDGNDGKSPKEMPQWKKTSLKKYFEPFQKEFLDPMIREHRRQERDAAEQKAAILGDF